MSVSKILKYPAKLVLRTSLGKRAVDASFAASEKIRKRLLAHRIRGITVQPDDIVGLAVVKNEELRLEYFFEYYRKLGLTKFIILDHGSTDKTAEIIDAEPLAVRVPVAGNFVYKSAWVNAVLETLCQDRWVLALDADEFFIYPHMDRIDLRGLLAFLEARGEDTVEGQLLDMYPEGNVWDLDYKPGQDPLDVAPYFDTNAATRKRVFGVAPYLGKAPLFRFGAGKTLSVGQHILEGARSSGIKGCLLHFKFLQDFKRKTSSNAVLRYFDRAYGRELAAYSGHIEASEELHLYSEDSIKYEGPDQLVELGFMATTPEWQHEAAKQDPSGDGPAAPSTHSPSAPSSA